MLNIISDLSMLTSWPEASWKNKSGRCEDRILSVWFMGMVAVTGRGISHKDLVGREFLRSHGKTHRRGRKGGWEGDYEG